MAGRPVVVLLLVAAQISHIGVIPQSVALATTDAGVLSLLRDV